MSDNKLAELMKNGWSYRKSSGDGTGLPTGGEPFSHLVTDVNGVAKWEERTHGEQVTETVLFSWDGDTSGRDFVSLGSDDAGMYKVSDILPTEEQLENSVAVDNSGKTYTGPNIVSGSSYIMAMYDQNTGVGVYVAMADNVNVYGVVFPTAGVYAVIMPNTPYVTSITLKDVVVKRLDYKFSPNGVEDAVGAEVFNDRENNKATGEYSHAEGRHTEATASHSHSEGFSTSAVGSSSHAEGNDTNATGDDSHAEGMGSVARGYCSHAEGQCTQATATGSHSEGSYTYAEGDYSHSEGEGTIAASECQHVQGSFNVEDAEKKYLHIVGNGYIDMTYGAAKEVRQNAHTLDWSGNAWFAGTVEGTGVIVKSSTEGSTKKFKITVDDSGTLTATEVT